MRPSCGLALARSSGDSFQRRTMSFTEELERQTCSRDRTIASDDRPIADRLLAAVQATHRAAEGLVAWANTAADRPPQTVRDDLRQAEQLLEDLRLLLATLPR